MYDDSEVEFTLGTAENAVINIAIFEPGHYFAQGSYGISASGMRFPIQATFSVEEYPAYLLVEGKSLHHAAPSIVYPFRVLLSRDMTSQSQADLTVTITGVPPLNGRASLVGPTFEFLATDDKNQNRLGVHVVPLGAPTTWEVSGMLLHGGKTWLPFQFKVVRTEAEAALDNVVALPKRA